MNDSAPIWDATAGLYIANEILSVELDRCSSVKGQEIILALTDVIFATAGNLGCIAEVRSTGKARGALGGGLYGAYGQPFECTDGR